MQTSLPPTLKSELERPSTARQGMVQHSSMSQPPADRHAATRSLQANAKKQLLPVSSTTPRCPLALPIGLQHSPCLALSKRPCLPGPCLPIAAPIRLLPSPSAVSGLGKPCSSFQLPRLFRLTIRVSAAPHASLQPCLCPYPRSPYLNLPQCPRTCHPT